MSEQPHSQQPAPTQAEIDSAHEVALARDHHETNAARALASMKLVEKALTEYPEDIEGQLQKDRQAAIDGQVPDEVSSYERSRNISVANAAYDVYSHQKHIEHDRFIRDRRNLMYPPSETPDRKAADFAVHKLRSAASRSKYEADNAEQRMRQGR